MQSYNLDAFQISREWVWWLKAHTALIEDLSLIPSIHIKWLIITHKSSSRSSDAFSWIPGASELTCTYNRFIKRLAKGRQYTLTLKTNQTHGQAQ